MKGAFAGIPEGDGVWLNCPDSPLCLSPGVRGDHHEKNSSRDARAHLCGNAGLQLPPAHTPAVREKARLSLCFSVQLGGCAVPAVIIIRLATNQPLPETEDWVVVEWGASGHFVSTCVVSDDGARFWISESLPTEQDAFQLATKFAVEHGIETVLAKGFPNVLD